MAKRPGQRKGMPENVTCMWAYMGERRRKTPMPCEIAAYRYANGAAVPEGALWWTRERRLSALEGT
jgi:hypothetical protein